MEDAEILLNRAQVCKDTTKPLIPMTKEEVLQALKAAHAQKGLPTIAKDLGIVYNNVLYHANETRTISNMSYQLYRLYFENKKLRIMVQKLLLEE